MSIEKEKEKQIDNINIQAWVPVERLATAIRFFEKKYGRVSSISDFTKSMVELLAVAGDLEELSLGNSEKAIIWLSENKFKIGQVRRPSKKLYRSMVQEQKFIEEIEDIKEQEQEEQPDLSNPNMLRRG